MGGTEIPEVESLGLPDTVLGRLIAAAYTDQTLLGWNVLFRGFWAKNWRLAQEEQFRLYRSRERQDTGDRWSGRAQMWFIALFESLWGLRNDDEHGVDFETQWLVRETRCERAIRRLYNKGEELPFCERHPFRDPMEDLLARPVTDKEMWISSTERYLPKAFRRIRKWRKDKQPAITEFFTQ